MGKIDKSGPEFGLGHVRGPFGLNPGFLRPPKARCIRQTKHSVADSGKANCQAYDDKTHTITRLLGVLAMLRSRTVILPSSTADMFAVALVQVSSATMATSTPSATTTSTIIRKRQ